MHLHKRLCLLMRMCLCVCVFICALYTQGKWKQMEIYYGLGFHSRHLDQPLSIHHPVWKHVTRYSWYNSAFLQAIISLSLENYHLSVLPLNLSPSYCHGCSLPAPRSFAFWGAVILWSEAVVRALQRNNLRIIFPFFEALQAWGKVGERFIMDYCNSGVIIFPCVLCKLFEW